MKKTLYIFLAALCVACSADEGSFDISIPDGMVLMRFDVEVASEVEVSSSETRSYALYMIPDELLPTEDDLKLEIYQVSYDEEQNTVYDLYKEYASLTEYNASVEEEESSDDVDDMLRKSPYLPAGDYFARVSNGLDISEESVTNAYFADSTEFTIVARDTERTTSLKIMLQNSIIMIEVTDNFTKYFEGGATLKLTTESGNGITLELPLEEDYEPELLYVQPDTELYIEGSAIKQDPGTGIAPTVKFTKSVIGTAVKSKLNCVVVDADDAGGATLTVTINDQITQINEQTLDLHN